MLYKLIKVQHQYYKKYIPFDDLNILVFEYVLGVQLCFRHFFSKFEALL